MAKKQETSEEREAQFRAFVEASRELECDEDPEAFKGIVRKVVSAPKPLGEWRVEDVKVGVGYKPVFRPDGYGPSPEGPTFSTEAEAEAWIKLNA